MAFVLVPRGWETSSTTGTGALTLAGAVTDYPNTGDTWRAFSDDLANNDTTYYAVVNRTTPTEWEEGIGTWGTGGILTRTTIIRSSNSNNAVSFTAGTLDVMCSPITPAAVPPGTSGGVLYFSAANTPASSAALASGSVVLGGGTGAAPLTYADFNYNDTTKRATVGTGSGTSAGVVLGYTGTSGWAGIWPTSQSSPSQSNAALAMLLDQTVLAAPSGTITFSTGTTKGQFFATAGRGLALTAGTATTDVNALSATQTWNAAGVTFKAHRQVVTVTAAAAGSLDMSLERSTGQGIGVSMLSELTTIAAAATTATAIQIPANAIVLGVSVRVTTVIPTATNFTVTGTTSATAFQTGASVAAAANTTDAGTKNCPYLNATAQTITITPDMTPADNSGRVRVTIHYIVITPPTS